MLLATLVIGITLTGGCTGEETEAETPNPEPAQIAENISAQEAYALIQENQGNPDFVIIDLRPPEEFAEERIEGAINLDYHDEAFQDEIEELDGNKTYLIYYTCSCGYVGQKTLFTMADLGFREVHNIYDGLDEWKREGFPTIQRTEDQIIGDVTAQEAYALVQQNQDNPDFVIIDLDSAARFARGHIENAINIDYDHSTIRDNLDPLGRDKTYLVYCRCSGRGSAGATADIMAELGFREVYNIYGGLDEWKAEGFPVIQ